MISGKSSVVGSSIWMVIISVLLSWFPFVGPLIGGVVGGHKAGNVGKALMAAILPALILGAMVFWGTTAFTGVPLLGSIAAIGASSFMTFMLAPMFFGALLGGLLK